MERCLNTLEPPAQREKHVIPEWFSRESMLELLEGTSPRQMHSGMTVILQVALC